MSKTKTIRDSLYFRVDFDGKYKQTKQGIRQDVKFFMIGIVPVVVEYENGDKENVTLNVPVAIPRDPFSRLVQGKRYRDLKHIRKEVKKRFKTEAPDYVQIADEIIEKAETAIDKALEAKIWNGKKINSLLIVKS